MSPVTICVLVYGDHVDLARRVLSSISENVCRDDCLLVVGANAVSPATEDLLRNFHRSRAIDRLIVSRKNLNKCPMMRRMFRGINTEFIWWFDDDSYITEPTAFDRWLGQARVAPPSTVMWGPLAECDLPSFFTDALDVLKFVRTAPWYRGLPPPSWRPGGKGEFNLNGWGVGDGRWLFILGGCWLIRTQAVRALDWPDPRLIKLGDDVFLGEAVRQQGWHLENLGNTGVVVNDSPRRGDPGPISP